jgi:hypothetical protein
MKKTTLFLLAICLLASCRKDKGPEQKVWHVREEKTVHPALFGGTQECFNIRESETQAWEPFCQAIEGFEYEKGHTYVIMVRIHEIKNPPQDGSSRRYELVKVISKD